MGYLVGAQGGFAVGGTGGFGVGDYRVFALTRANEILLSRCSGDDEGEPHIIA